MGLYECGFMLTWLYFYLLHVASCRTIVVCRDRDLFGVHRFQRRLQSEVFSTVYTLVVPQIVPLASGRKS
jgi:hypothetical protein